MNVESRPLLSRVAESVYWMARYIERAENVARFIGVNLHLQLDLAGDGVNQWESLVDASGDAAIFKERYGEATQAGVIKFLVFDPENPNSIYSCLRYGRENARSVRETISSEMWEQVNTMYLQIQAHKGWLDFDSVPEFFRDIRLSCHLFQGITDATMTHSEAWHFLRMGRMLERADKSSRMLDVKYFMLLPSLSDVNTPIDDIHWSAVLKSVSGFEMYRKRYGRLSPRDIVAFLVLDPEFPRAVRHCVHKANQSLHSITGTATGFYYFRSEQFMGQIHADLDFTSVDTILRHGLHEYLDALQTKLNTVDDYIKSEFFSSSL